MGQDSSTTLGFMVVNPDGTISYVFDGHVVATGVDLTASGDAASLPADRKVRWLDEDDQHEVAFWTGYSDNSGAAGLIGRVNGDATQDDLTAELLADSDATPIPAGVHVDVLDGSYRRVTASVPGAAVVPGSRGDEREIVRWDVAAGKVQSDFLQVLAEPGLKVIRGTVTAAGTIERGDGFTVAGHPAAGNYDIAFTDPFSSVPTIVPGAFHSPTVEVFANISDSTPPTVNGFRCLTGLQGSGLRTDRKWDFIAMGAG